MKFNFLILSFLSLSTTIFSQDTISVTLQDIFVLAEQNSRSVKIATYSKEESSADLKIAKYNRLPQISGRASADYATNMPIYTNGIFHTPEQHDVVHFLYNTGADFYMDLYKGSQHLIEIEDKKIREELASLTVDEQKNKVKFDVSFAFLELYRSYHFKAVIEKDIEDQLHQLAEIHNLFESGVVLHSDVLRIELELSKRELLLVEIQHDIERLNQQIKLLVGMKGDEILQPVLSIIQLNIPEFQSNYEWASHHAFPLQKSHLLEELTSLNVRKQKAAFLPTLSLEGTFTFANPQIFLYPYNESWYSLGIVGLKLRVPISSWYANKPQVQKSKVAHLRQEESHLHELDELKNELLNADLNYKDAVKKRIICEKNIALTAENLRIIKENYFKSTALITDLLDANMNHLKSIFDLETVKIKQLQYYYQIEYIKGAL